LNLIKVRVAQSFLSSSQEQHLQSVDARVPPSSWNVNGDHMPGVSI
jgi:hypothetical protein